MRSSELLMLVVLSTVLLQQLIVPADMQMMLATDDEQWIAYKKKYDKHYNDTEDLYRKSVWKSKVEAINRHNDEVESATRHGDGQTSYTMGINKYTDWTMSEVRTYLFGTRDAEYQAQYGSDDDVIEIKDDYWQYDEDQPENGIPDSVDWRTRNRVTPVKDQGRCSACYAFGAVAGLESQHAMKTGQLIPLSEQNLIDCSDSYGNSGCRGGTLEAAFRYVSDNGISTNKIYPYNAADNARCRYQPSRARVRCHGYKTVTTTGDERALMVAVAKVGPIVVTYNSGYESFVHYESGVYDEPQCTEHADHAMLVIGYGTYRGKDYWLVKNSWGTSWGMNGYGMLARNRNNQCGIASFAVYPKL